MAINNSDLSSPKGERNNRFSINRRAFLKVSAIAGVVVAASRILRFTKYPKVTTHDTTTPLAEGVITEKLVNTSCLNCSTRCATRVRVVNGKAVRIEGNPLSAVSEGKICPRGHIGLQVLYDSSRISGPLKRTNPVKGKGISPNWVDISWEEAMTEISARVKSLRDAGQPHKLLLFNGLNAISDEDLIHRFADAYGTPNVASGDAFENEAEKIGRWLGDGNYSHCAYDFGRTNYILAFGANIIESEKPLARNLRMWGKMRRERPNRAKVVVIDPRYSVTAAKADEWIAINPGTDGALAMAIANVIIREGLYDDEFIKNWTAGFPQFQEMALTRYTPQKVTEITGIDASTIERIAREFAQTKPAIAWIGRGIAGWPNGSYSSYAVFCLNALTGNIDVPGGIIYQQDPGYQLLPPVVEDNTGKEGRAQPRLDSLKAGLFPAAAMTTNQVADSILNNTPYPVEMAMGFNSNFSMSAPGTQRWDEALKKIPYYVHISPFISEMAEYADIILPAPTFMEAWGYDHSPPGSGFAEAKIKQPVVEPLHDTKDIPDIIFALARKLGGTVSDSFTDIGDNTEGFVRFRMEDLMPWSEFREKGVWQGTDYQYQKYDRIFKTSSRKFEFYSRALEDIRKKAGTISDSLANLPHYDDFKFLGDKNSYPLTLVTYQPLLEIENGSQNYPWAQEMYLVMHGRGWTNFVEINSRTARALGIKDQQMVWVESPFQRIKITARVIEGIHPEVVSIAGGQGHYADGQWQKGIGSNPNDIIGVDYDHLSGQSSFSNTRVKVYKV